MTSLSDTATQMPDFLNNRPTSQVISKWVAEGMRFLVFEDKPYYPSGMAFGSYEEARAEFEAEREHALESDGFYGPKTGVYLCAILEHEKAEQE
jgi:hypothetical protein